jgi:hypothetical protein
VRRRCSSSFAATAAHPAVAELALADSLAQNAIVNSGESALG